MRLVLGFVAIVSLLSHPAFAVMPRGEAATVTIPLEQYLELKKSTEKVEFASVETVMLTGEYRGRLEVKISGGASMPAPEIVFMAHQNNVDLTDCRGSAVLMVKDSQVQLIPQEKRFQVTCNLRVKNWNEVRLRFFNVLSLASNVKGVEPIETPMGGGNREVVLYRAEREIASVADEEPSAVGNYKIQMLTDENRFDYRVSIHNPNQKAKAFTLNLANGEVVQKISTTLQYKDANGRITFTLPPGDHLVRINGRLPNETFQPLIGKGLEYVLLDQHPLLTSKVETTAKRISAQDTKMQASFPSPRGYLLSAKDQMRWTKQQLQTFTATTYTIRSADYRYYWSKMGKNLVEARFNINNQGATEIPLTFQGKPTFVEINGVPQVLSKNDKDQLILRVPTGDYQTAMVQYQMDNSAPRGIASIMESLPRPETTMTNVAVNLTIPNGFHHVFASNGMDQHWTMNLWSLMWALLAALFVFKFLAEAQVRTSLKMGSTAAAGLLTFFNLNLIVWLAIVLAVALGIRHRHKLSHYQMRSWRDYAKVISFLVILATGIYVVRGISSFVVHDLSTRTTAALESMPAGDFESGFGGGVKRKAMPMAGSAAKVGLMQAFGKGQPAEMEADTMEMAAMEEPMAGSGPASGEDSNFQGLPAKIEIPNDGYNVGFNVGLLDPTTPIEIRAMIFPDKVRTALFYLACIFLMFALWYERSALYKHIKGQP